MWRMGTHVQLSASKIEVQYYSTVSFEQRGLVCIGRVANLPVRCGVFSVLELKQQNEEYIIIDHHPWERKKETDREQTL